MATPISQAFNTSKGSSHLSVTRKWDAIKTQRHPTNKKKQSYMTTNSLIQNALAFQYIKMVVGSLCRWIEAEADADRTNPPYNYSKNQIEKTVEISPAHTFVARLLRYCAECSTPERSSFAALQRCLASAPTCAKARLFAWRGGSWRWFRKLPSNYFFAPCLYSFIIHRPKTSPYKCTVYKRNARTTVHWPTSSCEYRCTYAYHLLHIGYKKYIRAKKLRETWRVSVVLGRWRCVHIERASKAQTMLGRPHSIFFAVTPCLRLGLCVLHSVVLFLSFQRKNQQCPMRIFIFEIYVYLLGIEKAGFGPWSRRTRTSKHENDSR